MDGMGVTPCLQAPHRRGQAVMEPSLGGRSLEHAPRGPEE